jgi:hypothetical protein
MVKRNEIELHIEELVLHGFPPFERHAVAEAVRAQLEARIANGGLDIARDVHIDRLDAGSVERTSIGDALYETIGPPARTS